MSMLEDYQNDKHTSSNLIIYLDDKRCQNGTMTTASEARLQNARALAKSAGGFVSFCDRLEMSSSQASQIIGERPTRNIGARLARRIEAAFEKPVGWLDVSHAEKAAALPGHNASADEQKLLSAFRSLSPAKQAALATLLEVELAWNGEERRGRVLEFKEKPPKKRSGPYRFTPSGGAGKKDKDKAGGR